jgi:hypothetical protein
MERVSEVDLPDSSSEVSIAASKVQLNVRDDAGKRNL